MNNKNLIIALLVVILAGAGYFIYQDQQSESVSVNFGGKEISIETR